jgi:hypothetical protein
LKYAPTSAVLPSRDSAADTPKRSPAAPSEAINSCCWLQITPEAVKIYAAPAPEFLRNAPTSAVLPLLDSATDEPKASVAAPSEAVNVDCWVQAVPERVKTHAAPMLFPCPDPTSAMFPSPDSATETPRLKTPGALSSDCWLQVPFESEKVYAAPGLVAFCA